MFSCDALLQFFRGRPDDPLFHSMLFPELSFPIRLMMLTGVSFFSLAAPDAASSALAHVQRAGGDPELEAALQIIAQRARSNYPLPSPPPTSPSGPSAPAAGVWPRDRKGQRPVLNTQTSTPQSSAIGANWSMDIAAPSSAPRSDVVEYEVTPPAYSDATRRQRQ